MNEPRIEIHATRLCPFCHMAERLLRARGIPYRRELVENPAARRRIRERTGWPTVPVILLDGELVGGFDELQALDRVGRLRQRLAAPPS